MDLCKFSYIALQLPENYENQKTKKAKKLTTQSEKLY